jgi:MoxR-like ATPase
MFCVRVGYPRPGEEAAIAKTTTSAPPATLQPVLSAAEIIELQQLVRTVPVSDDVVNYAVRLAAATRPESANGSAPPLVHQYVTVGASPRASQQLVLGGKARALLAGRYSVDFEDIRALLAPVMRHRLILNYRARAEKITPDDVAAELAARISEEPRK